MAALPITWRIEIDFDRDGSYTDVTQDAGLGNGALMSVQCQENQASQFTVVLSNRTGKYSTRNSSGTYWPYAGEEGIPVQLRATHNSINYTIWKGFVLDWDYNNDKPGRETVTIRCGDILALRGDDAVTVPYSSSYDVDGAFGAVFAAMGLAAGDYDVTVDSPQALPHFFVNNEPARETWAKLLSAEMGGWLGCPTNGKATFRPRNHYLGITSPTNWGDGTSIKGRMGKESRKRGDLVTKVEATLSPLVIGAGGTVVSSIIPSYVDISTGATISKALAPGETWGPIQIIPNRNGVQSITSTPVSTAGIDYLANSAANGSGSDRTSEITVTITAGGGYGHQAMVKNTHASNTSYVGLLVFRAIALTDAAGSEAGSLQSTSPTGSNDTGVGTVAWSNPTNIASSNDSRATVVLTGGQTSNYLEANALGFAIPSSAAVKGILFEVEASDDVQTTQALSVRVVKGGTALTTTTKTQVINTSEAYYGFGGPTELWGTDWTPGNINDVTFGCMVYVNSALADTYKVDHVKCTVFYEVPIGISNPRRSYISELAIPNSKVGKKINRHVEWVADDNLVRDFGHSELMKYRYPTEEITVVFQWRNDATVVEMLGLEYGQLKYYKDTATGARGMYADDYYRVVAHTHTITIGKVPYTTVRLRPSHLFHNIDDMAWDDFNRANDTSGLGTTPTGDVWIGSNWDINTNAARPDTASGVFAQFDLTNTDSKQLLQWSDLSGVEVVGFNARYVDVNNTYFVLASFDAGSPEVSLWKRVSGVLTNIDTVVWTPVATGELRYILRGSRHQVWLNRKRIINVADSALTAGTRVGMYGSGAGFFVDNYSAIGLAA